MTAPANNALNIGKSYIAALARRDTDALLSLLHDEIVMEEANPLVSGTDQPGAKTSRGEAVRTFMRDLSKHLSRVEFTGAVWRTTDDGLALFEAVGDMALSDGRPYRNKYLMVFEASEGKLIRLREYMNPVLWARACGVPLESLP